MPQSWKKGVNTTEECMPQCMRSGGGTWRRSFNTKERDTNRWTSKSSLRLELLDSLPRCRGSQRLRATVSQVPAETEALEEPVLEVPKYSDVILNSWPRELLSYHDQQVLRWKVDEYDGLPSVDWHGMEFFGKDDMIGLLELIDNCLGGMNDDGFGSMNSYDQEFFNDQCITGELVYPFDTDESFNEDALSESRRVARLVGKRVSQPDDEFTEYRVTTDLLVTYLRDEKSTRFEDVESGLRCLITNQIEFMDNIKRNNWDDYSYYCNDTDEWFVCPNFAELLQKIQQLDITWVHILDWFTIYRVQRARALASRRWLFVKTAVRFLAVHHQACISANSPERKLARGEFANCA